MTGATSAAACTCAEGLTDLEPGPGLNCTLLCEPGTYGADDDDVCLVGPRFFLEGVRVDWTVFAVLSL